MKKIKLGTIVQVLVGREAGSYAVVIDIESPTVVGLADGKARSVDKPKKKNIKHVQFTHHVGPKVSNAIGQGRVTNADVRSDLNQYLGLKGCE